MNGMDANFGAFKMIALLFPIIFVFLFAGVFFTLIKMLKQWNENSKKPLLNIPAKLVAKRAKYTHSKKQNQLTHPPASFYMTFEVESGEQLEFHVDETNYHQFIEEDFGELTYQGTQFIRFERKLK